MLPRRLETDGSKKSVCRSVLSSEEEEKMRNPIATAIADF